MIDRLHEPIAATATRIGRTDLGPATVAVDDDALIVAVASSASDPPIRVPLTAIDGAVRRGDELQLALRDGMRLTIESGASAELRDAILSRCRALPELTRALRAFGSRRGHRASRASTQHDQRRFFAPLLDARRRAGAAVAPEDAIAAFDAVTLAESIDRALQEFAAERHTQPGPERRALEAELVDLTEPLRDALDALGIAGRGAAETPDDLRRWRVWAMRLGVTFEVADRVWMSLDAALDATAWRP